MKKFNSGKSIINKVFTTFTVSILCFNLTAQNNYQEAMQKALDRRSTADTITDWLGIAAQFERIADVETNNWLPLYYTSESYCELSFMSPETEDKQKYIELSQNKLDMALKIAPNESELFTLQGLIYLAAISVDPMVNGQIYMPKLSRSLQTAMAIDSTNPRPVYLQALSIFYTPEQFGGGGQIALPLFEKSLYLFNNFETKGTFYPDWGHQACSDMITRINNNQQ